MKDRGWKGRDREEREAEEDERKEKPGKAKVMKRRGRTSKENWIIYI